MRVFFIFIFLVSTFKIQAQNSLNFGVNFGTATGIGCVIGPNLGYSFKLGNKLSIGLGGYYQFGMAKEKGELYYRYGLNSGGKSDETITVKYRAQSGGISINLKRYINKSSNNEEGGLYLTFLLGRGKGKETTIVEDFDTSTYRGYNTFIGDQNYFLGGTYTEKDNRILRWAVGIGYDFEIGDQIFLFMDGGMDVTEFHFPYGALYLQMGIRKRFYKL